MSKMNNLLIIFALALMYSGYTDAVKCYNGMGSTDLKLMQCDENVTMCLQFNCSWYEETTYGCDTRVGNGTLGDELSKECLSLGNAQATWCSCSEDGCNKITFPPCNNGKDNGAIDRLQHSSILMAVLSSIMFLILK